MEKLNTDKSTATSAAVRRRSLGTFFVSVLLSSTAAAGIGESEVEVQTRYGAPIGALPSNVQLSQTKCYFSDGYSIAVTYMKGQSVREMFAKTDKSKLTEKEIQRLLKANAGGAFWNAQDLAGQKNVPDGLLGWRTDDEKPRVALYDERTQAFFVTTQRFIDLTNAAGRRSATRMSRDPMLSGAGSDRLPNGFQMGNLGSRALPSGSPARKAKSSGK